MQKKCCWCIKPINRCSLGVGLLNSSKNESLHSLQFQMPWSDLLFDKVHFILALLSWQLSSCYKIRLLWYTVADLKSSQFSYCLSAFSCDALCLSLCLSRIDSSPVPVVPGQFSSELATASANKKQACPSECYGKVILTLKGATYPGG